MNQHCSLCNAGVLQPGAVKERLTVAGHTFEAELAALVCPACGASLVDGAVLQRFEQKVAAALASGPPSGEAFAFLRKTLPTTRAAFAALLQVPLETVKAWETSQRPLDLIVWVLICQMVQEASQDSTRTWDLLASLSQRPPTDTARADAPSTKLGRLDVVEFS